MTRFIAEKPGRPNQLFDLPHLGLTHGLGVGKTIKQRGRYPIDPLIGTLGRENGRHQQLPGGLMTQRTMGVPVGIFQCFENPKSPGVNFFICGITGFIHIFHRFIHNPFTSPYPAATSMPVRFISLTRRVRAGSWISVVRINGRWLDAWRARGERSIKQSFTWTWPRR